MQIIDEKAIYDRAIRYADAGQLKLANQDFRSLLANDRDNIDLLIRAADTEKDTQLAKTLLMRADRLSPENPQVITALQRLQNRVGEKPSIKKGTGLAACFLIAFIMAPLLTLLAGRLISASIAYALVAFFWWLDRKPHWVFRYGVMLISIGLIQAAVR